MHNFLRYLASHHPQVNCLHQLRREPHILDWMSHLHSQMPSLTTESYINELIVLRSLCNELAWKEQLPEHAHLIRREDIPRAPYRLPRPLTAQQDELLQQEFLRRNDLGSNAFLLMRHTPVCASGNAPICPSIVCAPRAQNNGPFMCLSASCKTERMVPVDDFATQLVQRLRFFRSLDPLLDDGYLLARYSSKAALVRQLRDYLHQVCYSLNLSTHIVPHQLRHTYATEMFRAGVGFPVLMKLLGHTDPDMTMRYAEVTLTDLQKEFRRARSQPRHLVPQPKDPSLAFQLGSTA